MGPRAVGRIPAGLVRLVTLASAAAISTACESAGPDVAGGEAMGVLVEELRLDPYALDMVPIRAIAVAEDGTIAIAQSQDGHIRFHAADGRELARVGRQGEGPGEFTSITAMGWVADTLWAWDARQRRLGLVGPDLAFVRHLTMPAAIVDAAGVDARGRYAPGTPEALLPDGSTIFTIESGLDELAAAVLSETSLIARAASDGVISAVLHRLGTGGLMVVTPRSEMSIPFANIPFRAVSPDGGAVAVGLASLDGPDSGTYAVTVVDSEGDTLVSRRYPFEGVTLPEAVADSVVGGMIDFARGVDPGLAAAIPEQVRVPPVFPPLLGAVIGRDGTLFVQMYSGGQDQAYSVIAGDGAPIGSFALPAGARVAVGDRDRIWTIERDSLDVETVARYSVTWE